MQLDYLLLIAAILLGARLPAFMNRLGMSKADKVGFVIIIFSILGLVWFFTAGLGMLGGFFLFLSR